MNCIKIELCEEDRARLDRLAAALEKSHDCSKCGPALIDYAEARLGGLMNKASGSVDTFPGPAPEPAPIPETPDPAPAPAPDPDPVPVVSLAEFQKALTLRCSESAETKAKVRALLNQYAAAASAVPAEKRAEVLAKLAQI